MTFRDDVRVELVQHAGDDRSVVAAARVSVQGSESVSAYDEANVRGLKKADAGLVGFLMRNRHGTPFEHNSMTFLVEAPIFVFREFHRHRVGWSYNETSGRYRELEGVFYCPPVSRPLVQRGKPGAYHFEAGTVEQYAVAVADMKRGYAVAWEQYQRLLAGGVAKEVARIVLPVATYSSMYATCNARSLMHFLGLRTRGGPDGGEVTFPSAPMHEIEQVARGMEAEFARLFPVTHRAFCENGRVAP